MRSMSSRAPSGATTLVQALSVTVEVVSSGLITPKLAPIRPMAPLHKRETRWLRAFLMHLAMIAPVTRHPAYAVISVARPSGPAMLSPLRVNPKTPRNKTMICHSGLPPVSSNGRPPNWMHRIDMTQRCSEVF
jgi:hypothetical protein